MFDTTLVIVGNVLVAPEWRRIPSSGSLVANFKVASTARRYDREQSRWVDGNQLRMRVTAWRRLAEGVVSSLAVGDPVVVYGRLYTRAWKDDDGKPRTTYEMEAFSIGHDLARGKGTFQRGKALLEGDESMQIGGEASVPVSEAEIPISYGDGLPATEEQSFADVVAGLPAAPAQVTPDGVEVSSVEVEQAPETEPPAEPKPRRSRRAPLREPVAA